MRRAAFLLAMIALLALAAPAAPARVDWSSVVDFTNTGLDPFSAADAALLKMLSPERIKNPTERVKYQQQLSSLKVAQASSGMPLSVQAPASVQSIDPGCQLTSSNPDGYDLCGYNSTGFVASQFSSGRVHRVWAGVQEIDTGSNWRIWVKSQAYGLTDSNVPHFVEFGNTVSTGIEAYEGFLGGGPYNIYSRDGFVQLFNCAPCYWTGSPHSQFYNRPGEITGASSFVRSDVSINGTNDEDWTDKRFSSYWWSRGNGSVYCNGPRDQGVGC